MVRLIESCCDVRQLNSHPIRVDFGALLGTGAWSKG